MNSEKQNRINDLQRLAEETKWSRGRKDKDDEHARATFHVWCRTYDELEKLMDEEDFEDFMWDLDVG